MKSMKKIMIVFTSFSLLMTGCGKDGETKESTVDSTTIAAYVDEDSIEKTKIELSDKDIRVDGEVIGTDMNSDVYMAKDIVYYEEGKDFTYGEGTEEDVHSAEEAAAHTVVHITQPGTYELSGSLSAGQIAVDLGEGAESDPNAVVTLILNNVDIHCSVAPAVIFYNVYECGTSDEATATKDVDTSAAGANVIIADGSENNIYGSYVARIYKSVELNDEGTEVVDSKKLHKYDAAFYSKMSMNVNGDKDDTGVLNIKAENEGLDTELHLTINGGNINIESGNDGINTNEDYVSVTTVNSGTLKIRVTGSTGEGDGIDSNGWLVINGGRVIAEACGFSADAGIDSDMGIHINGGMVIATGNMLDFISGSTQNYVVMNFAENQKGGSTYTLKSSEDKAILDYKPENDFSYLFYSSADLKEGTYTFWKDDTQLEAGSGEGMNGGFGGPGGMMPGGMEMPEGMERPEDMEFPEGMERPEDMEFPEGMEWPEDMKRPNGVDQMLGEVSKEFNIKAGGSYFTGVTKVE